MTFFNSEASLRNAIRNVPRSGKGPKGAPKIKKSTIENVDYFEMRKGGWNFPIFQKFKLMKYCLNFAKIGEMQAKLSQI